METKKSGVWDIFLPISSNICLPGKADQMSGDVACFFCKERKNDQTEMEVQKKDNWSKSVFNSTVFYLPVKFPNLIVWFKLYLVSTLFVRGNPWSDRFIERDRLFLGRLVSTP